MSGLLEVSNLEVGYGPQQVLKGLSLHVSQRQVVALLGGNGAGKTTTLNAIMGMIPTRGGAVRFEDQNIESEPAHRIFKRGVSLVAQWRELFTDMTVLENLELGAIQRERRNDIRVRLDEVLTFLPELRPHIARRAGTLSGGQQQMLAIARALMSGPKLLMLDEPSMGLAPLVVAELRRTIERLNEAGTSILLVEQNIHLALSVANYVYIIRNGTIVSQGQSSRFDDEKELFQSYIG